jgi:hypothetical protein
VVVVVVVRSVPIAVAGEVVVVVSWTASVVVVV